MSTAAVRLLHTPTPNKNGWEMLAALAACMLAGFAATRARR